MSVPSRTRLRDADRRSGRRSVDAPFDAPFDAQTERLDTTEHTNDLELAEPALRASSPPLEAPDASDPPVSAEAGDMTDYQTPSQTA